MGETTVKNKSLNEALFAVQKTALKALAKEDGAWGKYATLDSVWEVIRPAINKAELLVTQFPKQYDETISLKTIITHTPSGEFLEGTLPLVLGKQDMQALGSAITYARRYSLATMLGVIVADDDGQATVSSGSTLEPEASLAQKNLVHKLLNERGVTGDKQIAVLQHILEDEELQSLTKDQASRAITLLQDIDAVAMKDILALL